MVRNNAFSIRVMVILLLVSVMALSGVTSLAQGRTELSYGINNYFDTLDPNVTTFSATGIMAMHVFTPLVWQAPLGTFHPAIAESWTVTEDATAYTFVLRQDVTFHDGTPVNAEAVKFTFDRIADPETGSQLAVSLLGPYAESIVEDEFTVTVRFNSPYAPFLNSVSTPYLAPSSPTAIAELGEEYGLSMVVGAGPFMIESYVPNSELVLVRYDGYTVGSEEVFGMTGPATLERITFRMILEPATRLVALESGEVDFIDNVPQLDVARLQDDPNIVIEQIEQPGHGWSLMMNVEREPTSELAVRRAVAHSINKQAIIDTVFSGFGTPGCSPLTKVMFGFDPASCDYLPFDQEEAARILDEAGWVLNEATGLRERDGQTLTIDHHYRSDSPLQVSIATFLQANLAEVGIEVALFGAAQAGYFDAVRSGQHNTQGWWDTWTDPSGLRVLFHSANADGGTNRNRYRHPVMDDLLDRAAGTPVAEERVALYAEIQKLAADDAIMVYYNDPFLLYGYVPALEGVNFLAGGNIPYFYTASFN